MTWMASARPSILPAGDSAGPPTAAISSPEYPAPRPRMNRPPESWSSEAASLATMAGRRNGTAMTRLATRIRLVRAAIQVSIVAVS